MKSFKTSLILCLAIIACCAGCAKQEVVKQDQMIPPPAATPAAKPVQPASSLPVAKDARDEASLANSAIKESAADAKAAGQKDAAMQLMLDKVFFDFDSATLSPAARTTLDKTAEVLKKQGTLQIRIEGNCDELGSDDYNLSLGENRAASAKNYLKALGVAADRMSIISYGKEKPVAAGHDDASRAQNRRDEFVVLSK